MPGKPEGLACKCLFDALKLKEYESGLDICRPELDATLAATHADFEGLLGDRAVWEHPNPQFTGALDATGYRHSAGLDLAGRETAALDSLKREIAKGHVGPAAGNARVGALLHFTEFSSLGG